MALQAGQLGRVQALREASRVERCHTVPHHGSYTVGQHSFDALNLLFVLYPGTPRLELIKALAWHDVPERWLGDVPAPAKWSDGEFAKLYDRLDAKVMKSLELDQSLTHEERLWLNAVDKLELYLWAKEQLFLGNHNALSMIGNLVAWFQRQKLPVEVRDFIGNHKMDRLPDELP